MSYKVVFNATYGGFGLSEKMRIEFAKRKNIPVDEVEDYDIPLHDPDLVAVIESLSEHERGSLHIYELKGNRYIIDEYDGSETVLEPEDISWIEIE